MQLCYHRQILRSSIGLAGCSPPTLSCAADVTQPTADAQRPRHPPTGAHDHQTATTVRSPSSPTPTRASELVEPDWTRFPGWRDVTAAEWESVQWQRAHCVKNVKQLRELMGDLLDDRFYADLERDQAERATMSMLVPPQMMNTMAPDVASRAAGLADRRVLRRPGAPLHDPGVHRPPYRLGIAPAGHPGLAPRARHVGRRGAHPPLPHQGAGRAAADLPAVLRPLHPHGHRRQLHPDRSRSSSSPPSPPTGSSTCSTTCAVRRACATWWCPAVTSRTCLGRGSRRS